MTHELKKVYKGPLLLAESGGSKTDWAFFEKDGIREFQTVGLNPNATSPAGLQDIIKEVAESYPSPNHLIFYGAGLARKEAQEKMQKTLSRHFSSSQINVDSDLLAAAHACLGESSGTIGILGTGSIAFTYDGQRITEKMGGLGFLLGDEGGGAAIGREIAHYYFNGGFSSEIRHALETHMINPQQWMVQLYGEGKPQSTLAKLIPISIPFLDQDEIQLIFKDQMRKFIEHYLLKLQPMEGPLWLVGGIARQVPNLIHAMVADRFEKIHTLNCSPIQPLIKEIAGRISY